MFKPMPYIAAFILGTLSLPAFASPEIGKPAPDFEAIATNNKTVKLSGLKGKIVVLEWTNPQCPFVEKHYESGNMQQTQKTARADGAVWITINSSALGKDGHMTLEKANQLAREQSMN